MLKTRAGASCAARSASQHLLVATSKDDGELVVVQSDRRGRTRPGGAAPHAAANAAVGPSSVEQINVRERQVSTIGREHAAGNLARLRGRLGLPRLGRQRLRRFAGDVRRPPVPVVSVTMQSTPPTRPISSRIGLVGDVEVASPRRTRAGRGRRESDANASPVLDDALEQRADDVPDLAPTSRGPGARERRGCLLAQHRDVGVVVELHELRAPEQTDLGLRREQDADRAAEALRPGVGGAERGGGPLELADAPAHLATTREPGRRGGVAGTGSLVAHGEA